MSFREIGQMIGDFICDLDEKHRVMTFFASDFNFCYVFQLQGFRGFLEEDHRSPISPLLIDLQTCSGGIRKA